MRKTPERYFGPCVPPSSAFPKNERDLLSMSRMMARMAQTVYRVTLKPRLPEGTVKGVP